MLDNFTVVFRASGDALFYVVGDADEVRRRRRTRAAWDSHPHPFLHSRPRSFQQSLTHPFLPSFPTHGVACTTRRTS